MAKPINDDIRNAIVIAGDGFSYSGSTIDATREPDEFVSYEDNNRTDNHSVWFVYTPTADGPVKLVTRDTDFTTTLTAFKSADGTEQFAALEEIATTIDDNLQMDVDVRAGETYYFLLAGYADRAGAYTFAVEFGPAGFIPEITGDPGTNKLGDVSDGAQRMEGGLGSDAYYVDRGGDVVVEDADAGFDSIYTLVDYALPANVEKIVALGSTGLVLTGNALDNQLFGAAGADTLDGGLGNDRLDGRGGADRLVGGAGDDNYVVSHAGDVVVELADEGYDTVYASVNYTASANVEKIVARGSNSVQLTGNGSDNVMTGGVGDDRLDGRGGADRIKGGGGDDVLIGGAGKDVLTGGAGADLFVFAGVGDAGDTFVDFEVGVDRVGLELAGFGLSGFDVTMFESNARGLATGADTRFVYSESNGRLFFDADGSGAGKAVLLATLRGVPNLTADDFQVTSLIG